MEKGQSITGKIWSLLGIEHGWNVGLYWLLSSLFRTDLEYQRSEDALISFCWPIALLCVSFMRKTSSRSADFYGRDLRYPSYGGFLIVVCSLFVEFVHLKHTRHWKAALHHILTFFKIPIATVQNILSNWSWFLLKYYIIICCTFHIYCTVQYDSTCVRAVRRCTSQSVSAVSSHLSLPHLSAALSLSSAPSSMTLL